MGAHARLSPSAAETWCNCPGSVRQSAGVPDTSSSYAREGTAAHNLLERCLLEGLPPETYLNTVITVEDQQFIVDQEMVDAVAIGFDYVIGHLTETPATEMIAERKVEPGFLMNRKDCDGTSDISLILPTKITALDFKYGKGIMVEANGNLQTLLYGIGCLAALPPEKRKLITEIETGIIQPRINHKDGPIRTVTYPIELVYTWLSYFMSAALATDDPNAPLIAGDIQCHWCRGKPTCPALRDKTLEVFDAVNVQSLEPQVLRDPESLTIEELNLIDDNASIIMAFIKAVQGRKLEMMKEGTKFTGYKLVKGKPGNSRFIENDQGKNIRYVAGAFGLKRSELTAPEKILGPTKVIALAKKGPKFSERKLKVLEGRIERPEGKIMVVPITDPRPAVLDSVEEAFKDVPKLEN